MLARLDHRNIVPILDVGESGGIRYLAMELVRGQSLYDLIRSTGTLDEDTALDFVRQAALLSLALVFIQVNEAKEPKVATIKKLYTKMIEDKQEEI